MIPAMVPPTGYIENGSGLLNTGNGLLGAVAGYIVGKLIKTPDAHNGYPLTGALLGSLFGIAGIGALAVYGQWKSR